MKIFGFEDFVDIFWVMPKLDCIKLLFLCILWSLLNDTEWGIFLGGALKFQIIFGCLKFLIYFG